MRFADACRRRGERRARDEAEQAEADRRLLDELKMESEAKLAAPGRLLPRARNVPTIIGTLRRQGRGGTSILLLFESEQGTFHIPRNHIASLDPGSIYGELCFTLRDSLP